MIRYIYGNPGTGKSYTVKSMVVNDALDGRTALMIVPEQSTVSAEREIIQCIPPSAQLNVEVLNFTRLANKLFREHGGLSYNFLNKAHEKLIMWQAIKSALPFLQEYNILTPDNYSLSEAMLATYKELAAEGISIEQIEAVTVNGNNPLINSKIKDIATICSIYNSMLGEKFTDTNSELSRLATLLDKFECLKGVNIYIDGFTSFTGLEHRIIKAMFKQAENVTLTVCLPYPAYNGIDTQSIKECSDKLRRDCASLGLKSETVILEENMRTQNEALKMLSSDLWAMEKNESLEFSQNISDSVLIYKTADKYDECEFAAAKIKELIENGYRYRDFAIVARNIDNYRGIIEPALETMGIRFFLSEKSDLSVSPIAKFILSAIKTVSHGWQRNDLISHLKTGLCGISPHDADIFECYTSKWNISGKSFLSDEPWNMNPDGYTTLRTERGAQILKIANEVKATLIGNLKRFASKIKLAESYREMCIAVLDYMECVNVRDTMLKLASEYLSCNKIREATDCAKMYEIAIDALDCVCDVFSGSSAPDINTFSTAIRIAFAETTLGSIPTSQDEVTVGSANMLRTDNVKCTVILGACDGEFPASAEISGLLNDTDRSYLSNNGITMPGNKSTIASDELFYFRRVTASPSERLIIFTRSDAEPSIAITRILSVFRGIGIIDTSDLLIPRLRSLRSAEEYVKLLEGTPEGAALSRLIDEFTDRQVQNTEVSVAADEDVLDADTISKIYGNDLIFTQSKTESFVNCKFSFACKYHLGLDDGQKAEFSYSNIGTFIHYVLEKFLYAVYFEKRELSIHNIDIPQMVNQIIEKYVNDLSPSSESRSARLIHLIDRLKRMSIAIILDILNELGDCSFRPEFFEMRIGTRDVPSVKITLKNGQKISVSGIIDRVDVFRKDGKAYIRVIDYKTGSKTFSVADIEEGLNMQMLLYIFSLTRGDKDALSRLFSGEPVAAGISYYSLGSAKIKSARLKQSPSESTTPADVTRSGLILDDEAVIEAFSHTGNDKYLMKTARKNSFIDEANLSLVYDQVCKVLSDIGEEMLTGRIEAKPKNADSCKYCRYGTICRSAETKNR